MGKVINSEERCTYKLSKVVISVTRYYKSIEDLGEILHKELHSVKVSGLPEDQCTAF